MSGRAQPKAYWGAYGATKAGMEHLVLTWADEVQTTRLRVNLFDPGVVATGCAPGVARRGSAALPPPGGGAGAGRPVPAGGDAARRGGAVRRLIDGGG